IAPRSAQRKLRREAIARKRVIRRTSLFLVGYLNRQVSNRQSSRIVAVCFSVLLPSPTWRRPGTQKPAYHSTGVTDSTASLPAVQVAAVRAGATSSGVGAVYRAR